MPEIFRLVSQDVSVERQKLSHCDLTWVFIVITLLFEQDSFQVVLEKLVGHHNVESQEQSFELLDVDSSLFVNIKLVKLFL